MQRERSRRWQRLVDRVAIEYQHLDAVEKYWIAERQQKIEQLQQQLDLCFVRGDGLRTCADCRGECCIKGHNHMTLANLLGYLQQGGRPPRADFSRTCPFLGDQGCLLPVIRRPYSCISFACDIVENSLTAAQVSEFYALEQQLRRLYLEFAERYAGGGVTGLLLQEERLAGGSFLALRAALAVALISA